MDDDELIAAMAAGDDVALRELFSRHAPWLAARMRPLVPAADVEDVLQETFLAAWRGARGYRPEGAAGGWLWGIARRQAALVLRRRGPDGPALAAVTAALLKDAGVAPPSDLQDGPVPPGSSVPGPAPGSPVYAAAQRFACAAAVGTPVARAAPGRAGSATPWRSCRDRRPDARIAGTSCAAGRNAAGRSLRLVRLPWPAAGSRRALATLAACAAVMQAMLHSRLGAGVGDGAGAALQLPLLLHRGRLGHRHHGRRSVRRDPERATGRWLPYLRLAAAIALTAAAVSILVAGTAAVRLPGGDLDVLRNVAGLTGIGLLCAAVLGGPLGMDRPADSTW